VVRPFGPDDPGASFYQLLRFRHPERFDPPAPPAPTSASGGAPLSLPHGTTVLALRFQEGVVMAGDRRATEGYTIAERDVRKVHTTDRWSAIAFAGAAGPCMEFTRLFQVELEHYEKLEGCELSMDGKANKLAQMIRGNLPLAMQGLVVVPVYAGFDNVQKRGRMFKFDIAGGRYEEQEFCAVGSGGKDAKGTLRKLFRVGLTCDAAISVAIESLYDAADNDIATGGPDLVRGLYPIVKVISSDGVREVEESVVKQQVTQIIQRETR
jgi:proteasome beta subunit